MNREELQKIADLARIEIPDTELDSLVEDFKSTLAFIDKIKDVEMPANTNRDFESKNVFREDIVNPIESNDLVEVAPKNKNGFVQVPKVLE